MITGSASPQGTAAFAARFPSHTANSFYRSAQGLTVSSLGIGSYLGEMDELTDQGYSGAVTTAAGHGINFIDTSLNYRHQRSETAIGAALRAMLSRGALRREEFVICTKAGYLVPDAVPPGLDRASIAGNMHCMAPAFLEDQLARSRRNLDLGTIDVFYLHNPETQLRYVSADAFLDRAAHAFEKLEAMVADGRIRYYGTATWDGYRNNGLEGSLSLVKLALLAERIGGRDHHFRFIQLPFNLAMPEACGQRAEERDGRRLSVLDAAAEFGITCIASASLMQGRLSRGLPEQLAAAFAPARSDAARALQFARSAPGIAVALAGMSHSAHVMQNLEIAEFPPLSAAQFQSLFAQ